MRPVSVLRLILFGGMLLHARAAHAQWTPPQALENAVVAEIATRWNTAAENVVLEWSEPNAPIPADARISLQGGAGASWTIALRGSNAVASVRVRAGTRTTLLLASRALARGAVLVLEDIAKRDTIRWGPPQPGHDVVGWTARRTLAAGDVLAPPSVTASDAVRAGQSVRLVYDRAPVTLTTTATALASAPLGARVPVRLQNGRRVEVLVSGQGEVRFAQESTR